MEKIKKMQKVFVVNCDSNIFDLQQEVNKLVKQGYRILSHSYCNSSYTLLVEKQEDD